MNEWHICISTSRGLYVGRHRVQMNVPLDKMILAMFNLRAAGQLPGIVPSPYQATDVILYFLKEPKAPIILYPEDPTYEH